MRIVKTNLVAPAILVLAITPGCGNSKYADFKALMGDFNQAASTFAATVENKDDPATMTAACTALAKSLEAISLRLKAMKEKYPELSQKQAEWPAELDDLKEEIMTVQGQFSPALSRVVMLGNKAKDDQAFQAAFSKLNLALMKLK